MTMLNPDTFYGAIEEHAAKVGALAFPLVLWPAGGYLLAKGTKKLKPEHGAMVGLLFGIGQAWLANRKGGETTELAVFQESSAEDDVLEMPDNVVELADYRGCGREYGTVDVAKGASEVGKGVLLLGAIGLGILAYELHRSSKQDSTGAFLDEMAREEW